MNLLLGAGDQGKSRPLLGGLGENMADASSLRGGAGFGFSAPLEAFARVASSIASTGAIFGIFNPGGDGTGTQNPDIVER